MLGSRTNRPRQGADVGQAHVTLIEDVITTGGAVRAATLALREQGATVETVVCAIDRSGDSNGPLIHVRVQTRTVLTRADLDQARRAGG